MTRDELLHLLAQGEGQRLEFKQSLAELEDGACLDAMMTSLSLRLRIRWVA